MLNGEDDWSMTSRTIASAITQQQHGVLHVSVMTQ